MTELICLHTKNPLFSDSDQNDKLVEKSGKFVYPLVDGLPVLVANPPLFLAEMYYQYGSYSLQQIAAAEKFEAPYQGLSYRRNAAMNLKNAVTVNMELLREMINNIESYFSKRDLLKVAATNKFPEMEQVKAFHYLKRDWCGLPEGEQQLKIITGSISEIISEHLPAEQTALFLGAGTGRITCELSRFFRHSYATDLALPMAVFYQRIMSGNSVSFFDINYGNIFLNTHSAKSLFAAGSAVNYSETEIKTMAGKISYFIADACKLPLRDNSVDCIISAYFTDVVPFPKVFPEINRVMKKGGVFIHFGPLVNNFGSIQAMFSAEDIKSYLFKYGYSGLFETVVNAPHMKAAEKMNVESYDNWVYAAKKTTGSFEEKNAALSENTILTFESTVRFSVNGEIGNFGEELHHNLYNTYKDKNYDGAEEVIRLLRLIDGQKTLKQIASAYLQQEAGNENDWLKIKSIIVFLMQERILTIREDI